MTEVDEDDLSSVGRVLVTGSRGFIGRHLVRAMRAAGADVHEIQDRRDCDLRDLARLRERVASVAPSIVVHLAATPDAGVATARSLGDQANTVAATLNILRALEAAPGAMFVHAGSYKQYGRAPIPFTESGPTAPANDYGFAKQISETIAHTPAFDGIELVCLRIGPVFGPDQSSDRLVPRLVESLVRGDNEIPIADVPWDPVFITDAVAAIRRSLVADGARGRTLNVSCGVASSPVEVAAMVCEALEVPLAGRVVPWTGSALPCVGDIAQTREILGWTPRVSTREGVDLMVRAALGRRAEECHADAC